MALRLGCLRLFTWHLPDVVLHAVCGTVRGLFETDASWALLRRFQRVHGRAIKPSARLRSLRSVRNARREWTQAFITLSLSTILLSLAD